MFNAMRNEENGFRRWMHRRNPASYMPTSLKTPFLAFLLAYMVTLVALLEYARKHLPALREHPPLPGEKVPAATIPLTTQYVHTTEAILDKIKLMAPHPPESFFQGTNLPAYSTAWWGLSVLLATTHGVSTDSAGKRHLTAALAKDEDPFALGRCAMVVLVMDFTDNPQDCNALVAQGVWGSGPGWRVHLLEEECYSRAMNFDLRTPAAVNGWYPGPLTLTPDCWLEEEEATTTLPTISRYFPGDTMLITTAPNGEATIVFADTPLEGGWPLKLTGNTGGHSCWEIAVTPFFDNRQSTKQRLATVAPIAPEPQWLSKKLSVPWYSNQVIRAYVTNEWQDEGYDMPDGLGGGHYSYSNDYGNMWHAGCVAVADANHTTSVDGTPSSSTSLPAKPVSRSTSGPGLPTATAVTSTAETSKGSSTKSSSSTIPQETGTVISTSSSVASDNTRTSEESDTETLEPPNSASTALETSSIVGPIVVPVPQSGDRTTTNIVTSSEVSDSQGSDRPTSVFVAPIGVPVSQVSKSQIVQQSSRPPVPTSNPEDTQPPVSTHSRSQQLVPSLTRLLPSPRPGVEVSERNSLASISAQPSPKIVQIITTTISSSGRETILTSTVTSEWEVRPISQSDSPDTMTQGTNRRESALAESAQTSSSNSGILLHPLPTPLPPYIIPDSPSPTPEPGPRPVTEPSIRPLSTAEYLLGILIPVFLCTLLSSLIQIVTANARSIFPFAVLCRPPSAYGNQGAEASDSVSLDLGGIIGPWTSIRLLCQRRESLPFLLDLLTFLSTVLTTISTSTVTFGWFGFCDTGSHDGWCYMGLGYYSAMLRAAQGMLAAMAVCIVGVSLLCRRFDIKCSQSQSYNGKRQAAHPWSISNLVSLAISVKAGTHLDTKVKGLRDLLQELKPPSPASDSSNFSRRLLEQLKSCTFRIDYHRAWGSDVARLGIIAYPKTEEGWIGDRKQPAYGLEMHQLESVSAGDRRPDGAIMWDWSRLRRADSIRSSRTSQRSLLRRVSSTGGTESEGLSARSSVDLSTFYLSRLEGGLPARQVNASETLAGATPLAVIDKNSGYIQAVYMRREGTSGQNPRVSSLRYSIETYETEEHYRQSMAGNSERRLLSSRGSVSSLGPDSFTAREPEDQNRNPAPISDFSPSQPLADLSTTATLTHDNSPTPGRTRVSYHAVIQFLFLIALTGLLILITYYEAVEVDPVVAGPESFEAFMDSQSIGVSVLFTSLGVGITLFWDYFFSWLVSRTWMDGYQLVRTSSLREHSFSKDSILSISPPPVTVYGGAWLFLQSIWNIQWLRKRRHQPAAQPPSSSILFSLGAVSLAGMLSHWIPILLSHIPFHLYQTWELHLFTGWSTVVVLAYMVFVLGGCCYYMYIHPSLKRVCKGYRTGPGQEYTMGRNSVEMGSIAGVMWYLLHYTDVFG